ncbi:MAG: MFS transporter [Leptospirales bacterium]|nr:MFS transporter [Leptospirales bacterium]
MKQSRTISLVFFYLNSFLTLLVGNMYVYAMIIYSRALSSSDGFTGLVYICNYVPALLISFYAGTVLDHFPRKRVLLIFQTSFIITSAILAIAVGYPGFDRVSYWLLPALMLMNGAALAFIIPGRLALVGNLVQPANIPRATMFLHVMIIIGFGLAPAIVGVVKQHYEWQTLFIVIGCLYFFAYLFLFPVKPELENRVEAQDALESFREGIRFVKSNRLILELLLFTFVGLAIVGPIQVLVPQFAKTVLLLNEQQRGFYMTTLGVGLLFGGMIAQFLGHKFPRGPLMAQCSLISGLSMAVLAQIDHLVPSVLLLGAAGVFGGTMSTLIPAAIQSQTPNESRGRVMSIYTLIFQMTPAITGFLLSQLADRIGIPHTLVVCGVAIGTFSLAGLLFLPELRRYR